VIAGRDADACVAVDQLRRFGHHGDVREQRKPYACTHRYPVDGCDQWLAHVDERVDGGDVALLHAVGPLDGIRRGVR